MKTIFSKKINTLINTVLCLGMLSFSTCLNRIDLDIPKGFENTLVVQGTLIKGEPSRIDLTFSRLFDFTAESIERVNVREVILSDEEGNAVEIARTGTGVYRRTIDSSSGINIEIDKSYKINFSTFDGRNYESSFEPLLETPKIDSITFEPVNVELLFMDNTTIVQDSAIRYYLNTPLTSTNAEERMHLLWNLRETFKVSQSFPKTCYVTENLTARLIKTFNPSSIAAARLDRFPIYDHRFNGRLAEGNYFEVIQYAISPEAYEYWSQNAKILERDGNMFEAPAGLVSSNISNIDDATEQVLGYFYAITSDTARVYVAPEVAGNPRPLCPPPPEFTDPCASVPVCCNCLSVPISSTEKPSFWTE